MSAVAVSGLDFSFGGAQVLHDVSFALPEGARCLLVGRNGAGKSTLLRILAGRHMTRTGRVQLLGRDAFHDTSLSHELAFLGGTFPFDTDIRVSEILAKLRFDAAREDELVRGLGVNRAWHMHRISDGQRRRVQLLLALLAPKRVLLLDEATSDLDVLARLDLLALLERDGQRFGTTIVYATHVFDRLEKWATHLLWLEEGRVRFMGTLEDALGKDIAAGMLLQHVETGLRSLK